MSAADPFRLDGSTAIVVGGAGGLGAAIAHGMSGAGALPIQVAVASRESVERMAAEVEAKLGAVDVLVSCAGITHRAPAVDFPPEEWDRVLAVNLTGVFLACQVVAPACSRR
jgi:NAD(P)-dependent dehydrogenase (short-subunit alcohol dehydrogenase family)